MERADSSDDEDAPPHGIWALLCPCWCRSSHRRRPFRFISRRQAAADTMSFAGGPIVEDRAPLLSGSSSDAESAEMVFNVPTAASGIREQLLPVNGASQAGSKRPRRHARQPATGTSVDVSRRIVHPMRSLPDDEDI